MNLKNIILIFLKKIEKEFIKRLIITSILATDMSKHKKLVDKFQKRVAHTLKYIELETKNEEIDELTKYLYLSKDNPDDRRVFQFTFN